MNKNVISNVRKISLDANAGDYYIGGVRHASSSGKNVYITAGGAKASTANLNAGTLYLGGFSSASAPATGQYSTGSGTSATVIQRSLRDTTSTKDNRITDALMITSEKNFLVVGNTDSLFQISLEDQNASNINLKNQTAGQIFYTIHVGNATDVQSISGVIGYAAVRIGTNITTSIADIGTPVTALSGGTLSPVWSIGTSIINNKITIKLAHGSSLSPTSVRVYYYIHNGSRSTITQL
jgi:hypothetical protein